jgi:hypothetical protein
MPPKLRPAAGVAGLGLVGLALAGATGCGNDDELPKASVRVVGPADSEVVHGEQVEVQGRVRPRGARVLVAGRPATVAGRSFRAVVELREGGNVIDVAATAPGRAAAFTAVRVSRQSLVRVPDLAGAESGDAVDRLAELGLRAEVRRESGLLDRLLPSGWAVCETDPPADTELARGEVVLLTVSKTC